MSDLLRVAENYLVRKGKLKLVKAIDDALEAKDDEIERLKTAMLDAYRPGCDCETCTLVRIMEGWDNEKVVSDDEPGKG